MLLEQIQDKVKAMGLKNILHDAFYSMEFKRYYQLACPGENFCTTCPNEIQTKYDKLMTMKKTIDTNRQYLLKKGIQIDLSMNPVKGCPVHITNDNLTDKVREILIAKYPVYERMFEKNVSYNAASQFEAMAEAPVVKKNKGLPLEQETKDNDIKNDGGDKGNGAGEIIEPKDSVTFEEIMETKSRTQILKALMEVGVVVKGNPSKKEAAEMLAQHYAKK